MYLMREKNTNKWEHGDMFKHVLIVQFLMNRQTGSQLSKPIVPIANCSIVDDRSRAELHGTIMFVKKRNTLTIFTFY